MNLVRVSNSRCNGGEHDGGAVFNVIILVMGEVENDSLYPFGKDVKREIGLLNGHLIPLDSVDQRQSIHGYFLFAPEARPISRTLHNGSDE